MIKTQIFDGKQKNEKKKKNAKKVHVNRELLCLL